MPMQGTIATSNREPVFWPGRRSPQPRWKPFCNRRKKTFRVFPEQISCFPQLFSSHYFAQKLFELFSFRMKSKIKGQPRKIICQHRKSKLSSLGGQIHEMLHEHPQADVFREDRLPLGTIRGVVFDRAIELGDEESGFRFVLIAHVYLFQKRIPKSVTARCWHRNGRESLKRWGGRGRTHVLNAVVGRQLTTLCGHASARTPKIQEMRFVEYLKTSDDDHIEF